MSCHNHPHHQSAGRRFRDAIAAEKPLQVMGTVNAYAAMMATKVGYKAIYLSGAGCANYSYGLPDLGITSLEDVLIDVRRITAAVDTPLLVDIDTGWGGAFNISRTVTEMIRAGVAAMMSCAVSDAAAAALSACHGRDRPNRVGSASGGSSATSRPAQNMTLSATCCALIAEVATRSACVCVRGASLLSKR